MSYGPNLVARDRELGHYLARILNGEKPVDLPGMQFTKFEFVINLKTAKALGLELPLTLQTTAEGVILRRRMSAFGTKRTFGEHPSMSAFGGKADIANSPTHVRL